MFGHPPPHPLPLPPPQDRARVERLYLRADHRHSMVPSTIERADERPAPYATVFYAGLLALATRPTFTINGTFLSFDRCCAVLPVAALRPCTLPAEVGTDSHHQ
jgi:hypothetical protein